MAVYVRNVGNTEYITGTANVAASRVHRPSRRAAPVGHAVHAAPLTRPSAPLASRDGFAADRFARRERSATVRYSRARIFARR